MKNQNVGCKGIIGLIFGHNFQPRYSTVTKPQNTDKAITAITGIHEISIRAAIFTDEDIKILEKMNSAIADVLNNQPEDKIYIKDVCIHCGTEITNIDRPDRRLDTEL